jgi:hypothetical protein
LPAILRDTTTVGVDPNSRLVFLSRGVYSILIDRFKSSEPEYLPSIALYLESKASNELLIELDKGYALLIDEILSNSPEPEGHDLATRFLVRLDKMEGHPLLTEDRRAKALSTLKASFEEYGWCWFVRVDDFCNKYPEFVKGIVCEDIDSNFESFQRLFSWCEGDFSSKDLVENAQEIINTQADRLEEVCGRFDFLTIEVRSSIASNRDYYFGILEEKISDFEKI